MAINNDVHGVEQYLPKLAHTLPVQMYITIPNGNHQSDLNEWRDIHIDTSDVDDYILRKEGIHEHLSFDPIRAAESEYWAHVVYQIYGSFVK